VLGDRWGVRAEEVSRRYPCDELVGTPVLQAWRAVTVRAEPDRVWPWIGQIRLAPYSYDWIDNFGRRSPRQLRGLPEPEPGEPFTTCGSRRLGRILSVTPAEQLTATIVGAVMTYTLAPEPAGTRLLLKVVLGRGRLYAPLVCLGDLVMARRQLLTLARLAERT